MKIHPSAVVSPSAELGPGVKIGPYSTIGEHVTIGRDNKICPFSSIGNPPQDIAYHGEDTRILIGNDNVIREYVTINRATTKEEWQTVVGNHNFIMAYAHIAHDCFLGDRVIMSNMATLGGHITIGDHAILGGLVAVHQFVRIGSYAFVGGKSGIDRDVPPFMITAGARAKLYGINRKGLSRAGVPQESIDGLKKAYRIIWKDNRRFSEGIKQARDEPKPFPELDMLLNFFDGTKRGVLR
jgi:UDP-N-acetylglucosamine acyltransferase